jgi:hypothetical protein
MRTPGIVERRPTGARKRRDDRDHDDDREHLRRQDAQRQADGGDDDLHGAARIHRDRDRRASQNRIPPRRAQRAADQLADAGDRITTPSIWPPPSDQVTRRPTMPKKISASTPKVTDSSFATVSLRSAASGADDPRTNAPNTGHADPLGRRRAQERDDDDQHQVGVRGLKCSVAIRTATRRTDRHEWS